MPSINKRAEQARALFTRRVFEDVPVCQHERCANKDCCEAQARYTLADDVRHDDERAAPVLDAIRDSGYGADFSYMAAVEALDVLAELDDDADEDAAREALSEHDCAPVYTSDLTAWLDEDNRHVYALTDAIKEYGDDMDGFGLLGCAYGMAWREVAEAVLSKLTA